MSQLETQSSAFSKPARTFLPVAAKGVGILRIRIVPGPSPKRQGGRDTHLQLDGPGDRQDLGRVPGDVIGCKPLPAIPAIACLLGSAFSTRVPIDPNESPR